MSDEVVDELHGDLFLCVVAEEVRERVLEDDFDLHPDCKHDHRHVESHENALLSVFGLKLGLDLGDRDE